MDDVELKRVAEAAIELWTQEVATLFDETFDPPTVLGLLTRLEAAEARVGVLEGLLQRTKDHLETPMQGQYEYNLLGDRLYRDIAQALTQEPAL